jgi:Flp pilus assembly protein TadD
VQLNTEGFVIEEGLDQRYEVLKELGDCHTALGNHDRARQCYEEAAMLAPDRAGPHVGRGVIGLQTGRFDDAERAFREALSVEVGCAEAYGGLAMVAQQREDYSGAFDMYLACLEKDPDNLVALLGLFQTSCAMGSFAQVTDYLNVYLDRHPGDTSVLFCLATLYARDGRLGEARDALLTVLALEPDNGDARELLVEVEEGLVGAAGSEVTLS